MNARRWATLARENGLTSQQAKALWHHVRLVYAQGMADGAIEAAKAQRPSDFDVMRDIQQVLDGGRKP